MSQQVAFTAPHSEAAKIGRDILLAGGTASEAMVAAAAMIAVQYPHMNGLGGDGFWLICKPGEAPIAIDACGAASHNLDLDYYRNNYQELPESGGESAITMAGTVAGWQQALESNNSGLSLSRLLQPAADAAREGITVTQSLVNASEKTFTRLKQSKHFADIYLKQAATLQVGDIVRNPALAKTLERLAQAGLDDFYQGELAKSMARELEQAGSPIRENDFQQHQAKVMPALQVPFSQGQLYNFGAPTQGVASLLILAIYDKLAGQANTELEHIHLLVEATKQAFILRDQVVTDEAYLAQPLQSYLNQNWINQAAAKIDLQQAKPWPHKGKPGDTIWMGACDQDGTMVSFIQSVYWEFGSGVMLPSSGVLWNIRAKSFTLDPQHHNALAPGKKPFHTLNPAYAELSDGRRMVYGTMGGEGQPQTQACLMSRYLYQGKDISQAIRLPRWLLGRTWGDSIDSLQIESSLYDQHRQQLEELGHELTRVADQNELMGHAGAIVLHPNHTTNAASDPRSDGAAYIGETD
ncbi:gamma-glutamyltransferase family protein [Marinomonas epiphytica]